MALGGKQCDPCHVLELTTEWHEPVSHLGEPGLPSPRFVWVCPVKVVGLGHELSHTDGLHVVPSTFELSIDS